MKNRISKDDYYIEIARVIALRSPCLKAQVGAIIVKNDSIVATGYNGPPRGESHCEECVRIGKPSGSDYRDCPAVHAEENAIINAARQGSSILGGTIYISHPEGFGPCVRCRRAIKNAGIERTVLDKKGDKND